MNELNKKSAGELAALIKEKQVSSTEVVEAHLKRIEEVNPDVNAITLALGDTALAAAKKADDAPRRKQEAGKTEGQGQDQAQQLETQLAELLVARLVRPLPWPARSESPCTTQATRPSN